MGAGEAVLAVHGGAGGTAPSALSPRQRRSILTGIGRALAAGRGVLDAGGSAAEAVVVAVGVLEDDEAFNAGRGAVLRDDGAIALDASVMWGLDRTAGAVAGARRVRNPVRAAEAVRVDGRHVLLHAEGVEAFALRKGLELVDPAYFLTDARRDQLERARQASEVRLDYDVGSSGDALSGETVGAVALDAHGHLAAATSTGGMTNASSARIGDSPLIGAGTWADDATVAVSATGMGEAFIRCAFAHEVDAGLRLAGLTLAEACERALGRARDLGGRGGCIAVDRRGVCALPFNTSVMPRGHVRSGGPLHVALFDEPEQPIELEGGT